MFPQCTLHSLVDVNIKWLQLISAIGRNSNAADVVAIQKTKGLFALGMKVD